MKYIFIITLILQLSLSVAQEDQTDKPSWSEEMPEMVDAPEMNLDSNVDTNIDFGMDDLSMDRNDMFDDSEDVTKVRPDFGLDDQVDSDEDITDDNNQADQDQAVAEKLAADKVAQEQAATDKIAADKVAQEQADADKVAQEQAEADKAAADKVAQEQAAADNVAQEQASVDNTGTEQAAAEKDAQDKAAAEKVAQDQAAADQLAKEQAEAEQSTNEQASVETVSPQSNKKTGPYKWVKTRDTAPKYPSRAARSSEAGWVDVELEINPNGDVVSTNVVSSYRNSKTFRRAATDAVKEWKFDPPMSYGIQKNLFRTYKITFKL